MNNIEQTKNIGKRNFDKKVVETYNKEFHEYFNNFTKQILN